MLVVITDYQYDNIDAERRIIGEAGFELRDYQVKETKELIPLVKEADAIVDKYMKELNVRPADPDRPGGDRAA